MCNPRYSLLKVNSVPAYFGLLIISISLLSVGCSSTPQKKTSAPIFYPPLPNPPRIQYLTSFSSASDVKEKSSTFSDFILGDEKKDSDFIKKPYGVAMHDGKIFVVDTRGPAYVVFDLKAKSANTVYGTGGGRMKKPINISIDEDGSKYITDTGREQILLFDNKDRFVRAYGVEGQFKPADVLIIKDKLYVTDLAHHKIHVLEKQTGKPLYSFAKAGSKDDELFFPTNMSLGSNGHLYVSDTGNFRIQEFTQQGEFVKSYGSVGSGLGQFARPKGVSVDRTGQIYVVDAAFENVQILNKQGKVLLFFGGPGGEPDNINLPADIEINYQDAALFQRFADPRFKLEYVILVTSQFGDNKVNVYGFGKMEGMDYQNGITD